MEMFFQTAYRHLKGESGLPSVLPSRESVNMARKKSRRVRLFCEALEKFCEILYPDPRTDAAMEGESPKEKEVEAYQKPRKYALESGEDLFQSLYPTNKTPPMSPALSSSTLVDPSSRKVSPSESIMDAKASPTVVKDFAYSSPDSKHVPIGDPEKEGSFQNNFRSAGSLFASAYSSESFLKDFSGEFGKGFDDVEAQGHIQQEEHRSLKNENVETEQSRSTAVEDVDRRASEKPRPEVIGPCNTASASRAQQEDNVEGSLDRSKGKVDSLSKKNASDDLALSGTMSSTGPTVPEATNEVKANEANDALEETGFDFVRDDQELGLGTYKDSSTEELGSFDNSKAQSKDFPQEQLQTDEKQTGTRHSIARLVTDHHEAIMPRAPTAVMVPITAENIHQNMARASIEDDTSPQDGDTEADPAQGTCTDHEGGSECLYEFSEPAGPATLWGILQSSHCGDVADSEVDAVEETSSVSEVAGPATLWGILQSNQSEDKAVHKTVADDETADFEKSIARQEATRAPSNSPVDGPVNRGGMPVDNANNKNESATSATATGAVEAAKSPGGKASAVFSTGISEKEGAKSGHSSPIAHVRPSKTAIPKEERNWRTRHCMRRHYLKHMR